MRTQQLLEEARALLAHIEQSDEESEHEQALACSLQLKDVVDKLGCIQGQRAWLLAACR